MRLPDFVIVGAMKAATSSFALDLGTHPEISLASKELHFFNSDGNFKKGINFYESFFSLTKKQRLSGEKTPSYSYHPLAASRMAKTIPDAKIIWILREPVSRAYSHYNFFVGKGIEWRSFKNSVKREMEGRKTNFTQRYLDRSIYSTQIKRFLKYYPKERMLFLLYEDFHQNRSEVLDQTCQFLGVELGIQWKEPKRSNPTYLPSNYFLQWLAYSIFRPKGFRIYKYITDMNRRVKPGYKPMDKQIQNQLHNFFKPHNLELANITGLDLLRWSDVYKHGN